MVLNLVRAHSGRIRGVSRGFDRVVGICRLLDPPRVDAPPERIQRGRSGLAREFFERRIGVALGVGGVLVPGARPRALFRGKVLDGLARARREGRLTLAPEDEGRAARRRTDALHRVSWVVYAKRPFGGAEQIYLYLGRYTHRVAISNARILSATPDAVTFRTRGDETAKLAPLAFLKRFLQHVLPPGFVKIRHYGLLASGNVTTRLERARALLGAGAAGAIDEHRHDHDPDEPWPALLAAVADIDISLCPACGERAVQRLPLPSPCAHGARAPPAVAA